MKKDVEETKKSRFPDIIWKSAFVVFVIISGYLTLKSELPRIESYFNPLYVEEPKAEAKKSVEKPTIVSLLSAVNRERVKAGIPPLKLDKRLNKSAQIKADDMKKRHYFGHVDPDGKHGYEIAAEHAPECAELSENITDSGAAIYNTTEAGIKAWVESPPHYSAMIDTRYTLTGFGVTSTGLVEHFCQQ